MPAQLQVNTDTFTLNTGAKIPAIGLGTWQSAPGDVYHATVTALKNGYRHIDTAAIYGNEEDVGRGIKDSGVPREEIFVTTKLWNTEHKNIQQALDISLEKLGLDYVDLYLIHWPVSTDKATNEPYKDYDFVDTYKELQRIYKNTKKVKAIGVSNFTVKKLQKLLTSEGVDVVPATNQVEAHPLLTQPDLYNYMQEKGIVLEAYSPLGSTGSPLFKYADVTKIAEKNGVEPAQVLISWAVQRKTVVLPKSVTEARIISNLKTFTLSDEDFQTLNKISLTEGEVRTCDPPFNSFKD
ncbi:Glycerol 2-dehydrogenase (NADP(+)) [Candida viswanathii]|jgi:glycerol 2-dehydrogenase (NADP+)|uniref:Glycerol 2-dehydrogenase (NADP(+)) n=1 Tax=Candida viswanathii TaxID=5486 RepID=A0A367YFN4_9ASCO|nr:Glycerol 2-dehydrogenase (NADP(+)) [Candida viswanathii]